jgi:hypothetical protein
MGYILAIKFKQEEPFVVGPANPTLTLTMTCWLEAHASKGGL